MKTQRLNPDQLYDPAAFGMSQATIDPHSGLVFVSGQVAWDVNGRVQGRGYGEQTSIALANLSTVLAAAGCAVSDVLSVRVYVRGEIAEHLPECGPLLAAFFGAVRPALTGIGVASLATPDTLIEIEAVARVPAAA
ncbi:MAG TPA: RidA family protein [Polyangiaceae bacterium]|nr:RidA family protein [Polyangiaceae bacterium]